LQLTRRRFIGWSGALLATVAARPVLSAAGLPLFNAQGPTAIPDLAAFRGQLGTSFRVKVDAARPVAVALAEAAATAPHPKDAPGLVGDAFSIIFKGPKQRPIAQGTYVVEHGALGSFSALIVPVERVRIHRFYQVVVNQRVPALQRSLHG
jgi:hypothetical protein